MGQEKSVISRKQIVAARGLLEMTQEELAQAVGVTVTALSRIESGKAMPRSSTLEKIRQALENRGIEFTNGTEPGVRFSPSKVIIPVP